MKLQEESMPKFRTGDLAMYLDPKFKDKEVFVKVEIKSCTPDAGSEPFYAIRFMSGKDMFLLSHAFERQLFTLEEYEERQSED